jgi:DNA-binding CsgD family transcriptional regulator
LEIIPNNQNLTAKERELIHLTLDGMTNKEIAVQMGITENTVKTHLKHIYAKTGILNKNQLLAMFLNTFSQ